MDAASLKIYLWKGEYRDHYAAAYVWDGDSLLALLFDGTIEVFRHRSETHRAISNLPSLWEEVEL